MSTDAPNPSEGGLQTTSVAPPAPATTTTPPATTTTPTTTATTTTTTAATATAAAPTSATLAGAEAGVGIPLLPHEKKKGSSPTPAEGDAAGVAPGKGKKGYRPGSELDALLAAVSVEGARAKSAASTTPELPVYVEQAVPGQPTLVSAASIPAAQAAAAAAEAAAAAAAADTLSQTTVLAAGGATAAANGSAPAPGTVAGSAVGGADAAKAAKKVKKRKRPATSNSNRPKKRIRYNEDNPYHRAEMRKVRLKPDEIRKIEWEWDENSNGKPYKFPKVKLSNVFLDYRPINLTVNKRKNDRIELVDGEQVRKYYWQCQRDRASVFNMYGTVPEVLDRIANLVDEDIRTEPPEDDPPPLEDGQAKPHIISERPQRANKPAYCKPARRWKPPGKRKSREVDVVETDSDDETGAIDVNKPPKAKKKKVVVAGFYHDGTDAKAAAPAATVATADPSPKSISTVPAVCEQPVASWTVKTVTSSSTAPPTTGAVTVGTTPTPTTTSVSVGSAPGVGVSMGVSVGVQPAVGLGASGVPQAPQAPPQVPSQVPSHVPQPQTLNPIGAVGSVGGVGGETAAGNAAAAAAAAAAVAATGLSVDTPMTSVPPATTTVGDVANTTTTSVGGMTNNTTGGVVGGDVVMGESVGGGGGADGAAPPPLIFLKKDPGSMLE